MDEPTEGDVQDAVLSVLEVSLRKPALYPASVLMMALVDGIERGWVDDALMFRDEDREATVVRWKPTARGRRAIAAWRRRVAAELGS